MIDKNELQRVGTIVLNSYEFERLKYYFKLTLPYHRVKSSLPRHALDMGDNSLVFYDTEKQIVFRKEWSFKKQIREITCMVLKRNEDDEYELEINFRS